MEAKSYGETSETGKWLIGNGETVEKYLLHIRHYPKTVFSNFYWHARNQSLTKSINYKCMKPTR